MKGVLVSACLLDIPCRYDGRSSDCRGIHRLMALARVVPFCPEVYGGLPTPRERAEIRLDRVYTDSGTDVTQAYLSGARCAARLARELGCEYALLKDKSPSCGAGLIYDGSFTGTLIPGDGLTVRALRDAGVIVFPASEIEALIALLGKHQDCA